MVSSYKDKSDIGLNEQYTAEDKRKIEILQEYNYQGIIKELELYVNQSLETMLNDFYEKCKEENKKLQDEKFDFIYCQHAKNTCVKDKDACQKDYKKCKEENKKLQDEKFDFIYCQHAKNTCVKDKDACTQQLKEKKIKHENDKENMHRQRSEYQIKLTKCEVNFQHTINALGHCEKKLEKTWW